MNFKQSLNAVKNSVNEAIKETGLVVTSMSLEDQWRSSFTISVPKELEQLTAKLEELLRSEGVVMRSLVFSWTLHGGWSKDRKEGQARITISTDNDSATPEVTPSSGTPGH